MDWNSVHSAGLGYDAFLQQYASDAHRQRWQAVYDQVELDANQRALLGGFVRRMKVVCLAGAWCGDCVNQCPILCRIAEACDRIDLRFLDRDAHPDVQSELSICGGHRVPVVVFLSEDGHECARYGDRTLSRYRELARSQLGPACPTGIGGHDEDLLKSVTEEWLREFERVQLMLRLSPRLRGVHGD